MATIGVEAAKGVLDKTRGVAVCANVTLKRVARGLYGRANGKPVER